MELSPKWTQSAREMMKNNEIVGLNEHFLSSTERELKDGNEILNFCGTRSVMTFQAWSFNRF